MKKNLVAKSIGALALLAIASPALAQDGGGGGTSTGSMAVLSAGLCIGIAAALCGIGQGRAVAAACEGTARNPASAGRIFTLSLIGLAFIESLVIYALVISFALLGKA